MKFSV